MKETEHYHLKKPEDTDFVRVSDLNDNADAIDAKLHELATEVTPIARGGTGATDAAAARANLNAASQTDLDTLRDSVYQKKRLSSLASLDDFPLNGFGLVENIASGIRPDPAVNAALYLSFGEEEKRAVMFLRFGETQAWLNTRNSVGWHGWKSLV